MKDSKIKNPLLRKVIEEEIKKEIKRFFENFKDDIIVNPLILKPDPFSKCPEEIQLAAYQLMREKIKRWKEGRKNESSSGYTKGNSKTTSEDRG